MKPPHHATWQKMIRYITRLVHVAPYATSLPHQLKFISVKIRILVQKLVRSRLGTFPKKWWEVARPQWRVGGAGRRPMNWSRSDLVIMIRLVWAGTRRILESWRRVIFHKLYEYVVPSYAPFDSHTIWRESTIHGRAAWHIHNYLSIYTTAAVVACCSPVVA